MAGRFMLNTAIKRIRAQQLFDFHREEISVEHSCRFLKVLRESHYRHFDGESTGLPDPTLNFFSSFLKVCVAGIDFAPCIHNGDDWLARVVRRRVPHLCRSRSMSEGAEVVNSVPAMTSQFLGRFTVFRALSHLGIRR